MKLSTLVALFLLLAGPRGGQKAVKPVAEPPRRFAPLRAHFEAAGMPTSFVGEGGAILWEDGGLALYGVIDGQKKGIMLYLEASERSLAREGNLVHLRQTGAMAESLFQLKSHGYSKGDRFHAARGRVEYSIVEGVEAVAVFVFEDTDAFFVQAEVVPAELLMGFVASNREACTPPCGYCSINMPANCDCSPECQISICVCSGSQCGWDLCMYDPPCRPDCPPTRPVDGSPAGIRRVMR